MCGGRECISNPYASSQFCCEPKTALQKKKIVFKNNKGLKYEKKKKRNSRKKTYIYAVQHSKVRHDS